MTEFEPGRRYVLGCENRGCCFRIEMRVEPVAEGAKMVMTFGGQPLTFMAKVMSFLTKPLAKSVVKHCAKDLDELKAALESPRGA